MNKYLIDLHTHTNCSTHAYSTLEENIAAAKKRGLLAIAVTNHGPAIPDGPHVWSFVNLKCLPDHINGIRVYRGAEVNILNKNGDVDLDDNILEKLEIVLGGFHSIEVYGDTNDIDKNTNAAINCIKQNKIDIFVHLGNPKFPLRYEEVLMEAKKTGIAIELNNSSFTTSRAGSEKNCEKILRLAKKYGNFIALGSDAHFSSSVGELTKVIKLLEKVDFPKELVINKNIEKLEKFLDARKQSKQISAN
jgi:putative hydrolase